MRNLAAAVLALAVVSCGDAPPEPPTVTDLIGILTVELKGGEGSEPCSPPETRTVYVVIESDDVSEVDGTIEAEWGRSRSEARVGEGQLASGMYDKDTRELDLRLYEDFPDVRIDLAADLETRIDLVGVFMETGGVIWSDACSGLLEARLTGPLY